MKKYILRRVVYYILITFVSFFFLFCHVYDMFFTPDELKHEVCGVNCFLCQMTDFLYGENGKQK